MEPHGPMLAWEVPRGMDTMENVDDEASVLEQDPRAMELLGHYAKSTEEAWLTRKDCGESPAGPRSWNKLHGWLVAKGLLEPGFMSASDSEIPSPAYRITRAGRQEIGRRTNPLN